MAAIKTFAPSMQGHIVRVQCDNSAAVAVLQTGRGQCPILLACAREVWKHTAPNNISIRVEHIPGKQNNLADLLSRAHKSTNTTKQLEQKAIQCNATMIKIDSAAYKF